MTTTTYRNDSTGYRVTLVDNGRGYAEVTDSLNYRFPMAGADYPFAGLLASSRAKLNGAVEVPPVATPAPATSPLPVELQTRSARPLATGATLTMPTLPQARCLDWGQHGWPVRRGVASVTGATAPMPVLIAIARRGWLDLDNPARPTEGCVTDAGRRALAAYVAKNGEVL